MSNAISVNATITDQIVAFKPPSRSFTLHNSKKRTVEAKFNDRLLIIPAVNVVGPQSDTDADGRPIPGTYVVEDLYLYNQETGDFELSFDAARAISHVLGIQRSGQGQPGQATSAYAMGGLSILPRHPDRETMAVTITGGSQLAFEQEVDLAREYIDAFDQKNSKRKANGLDPVPGDREYTRCVRLIRQYEGVQEQQVKEDLQPAQDAIADEMLDEEIEIQAIMRVKVQEMTERAAQGKNINKQQLFDELMNDPTVHRYAQKQYRFRKKGRTPIPDDVLAAAANIGQTVQEIENDGADE